MKPIRVSSEIGQLKRVMVHTPGPELLAVTPSTADDYLFTDVIEQNAAREEHGMMKLVLERFAEVYEMRELLVEILEDEKVREDFMTHTGHVVRSGAPDWTRAELDSKQLAKMLIEGEPVKVGPLAAALNRTGYRLPPVPNLFFARDVGMVVNDNVIIGSMRHAARWSEEMLIRALFEYHPLLSNAGILYDGSREKRHDYTIEGGDLHPLRRDLVLVGMSDRSSPAAIDMLCDLLFERENVRDVIVVVLPGRPEAIHLDMIFTHIDRGCCVVSPRHFIGSERLPVLRRTRGSNSVCSEPDIFTAFREVEMPLDPVLCGGEDRAMQEREQWASGCNLFAVRPGLALAYQRNEATLSGFESAGFKLVDAEAYVTGQQIIDEDDRAILTFRGSELVRGGGGPRCMTMPIEREDP